MATIDIEQILNRHAPKRAYVRATKDGRSPEKLKKLGLESGAVARRRKPATRHSSEAAPSSQGETGRGE